VAMACVGTAQGADKIRYEELFAHFENDLDHGVFNVVTLDGKGHRGRLRLEFDHARVFHRDNRSEDLPIEQVSRIETSKRGRFFPLVVESTALPLRVAVYGCEGDTGRRLAGCIARNTPFVVLYSPAWAFSVAELPVNLVVAFLIPSKVWEIVH